MRKAILIGASSGIGYALAGILAQNGYQVAITGRRLERLEVLERQYPQQVIARQMDVQDLETLEPTLQALAQALGGLDLLVIAAGIGIPNRKLEFEKELEVIKTNVEGFTCIADWALRYFKAQGHGHLVNISSIASLRGNGIAPSYNATKAYQANYLEGLRLHADRTRLPIDITDIRPGFVDTDMTKGQEMFWLATPEKAATQIYHAIVRKQHVAYITRRWALIAWLMKWMPYQIFRKFD